MIDKLYIDIELLVQCPQRSLQNVRPLRVNLVGIFIGQSLKGIFGAPRPSAIGGKQRASFARKKLFSQ